MRCSALAQICLEQGYRPLFAVHGSAPALLDRIRRDGIQVVELAAALNPVELCSLITVADPAAIVLDGYCLDAEYRRAVAALGRPVLAIDDGNLPFALSADIVLNSSPLADPGHYARFAPGAELLLGPAYAPLRKEFRALAPTCSGADPGERVLLTLGGSDPAGLTLPLFRALLDALPGEAQLDIVLGAAHPDPEPVETLAADRASRVRLHRNTEHMAALMAGARLAVSAAGSTLWELASMGVPTVGVVVADNQADKLRAPASDWFLSVDARHGRDRVPQEIPSTALALWQDSSLRRSQSVRLRAIGVGRHLPDVCSAIKRAVEGSQ